jgi:hypothetical protein
MLPTAYDIASKVGFITRAGRGIGKGIAQYLASSASDDMTGQTLFLDGGLSL